LLLQSLSVDDTQGLLGMGHVDRMRAQIITDVVRVVRIFNSADQLVVLAIKDIAEAARAEACVKPVKVSRVGQALDAALTLDLVHRIKSQSGVQGLAYAADLNRLYAGL